MRMTFFSGIAVAAFLIFGTNPLWGGAPEKTAKAKKESAESVSPLPEPVYDVPDNARDPFFPPGSVKRNADQDQARRQAAATLARIRPLVKLQGIVTAGGEESRALVNGQLCEKGTRLKVKLGSSAVEVIVVKIVATPPEVVFRWGNEQFTKTPGAQDKKQKGDGR
ncbi:MAG: hypothetical protein GXP31_12905 [Kiritimatiellaeota bacterium]|nr:hypothetical protein [Kiritimatiellota bacterium]